MKTRHTADTGIEYMHHPGVGWRHHDMNDAKPGDLPRFVGPIYQTKDELLADHEDYLKRVGWLKMDDPPGVKAWLEDSQQTDSLRTGAGYALEAGLHATYRAMIEAADTIDTLRAQLAETRRDAERWRWLKDHARIFRQSPDMSGNHYWMVQATTTLRGPTLDAAIDAAKGEQ